MATDIDINRHYAALLGWTPSDLSATGFDDQLTVSIRTLQAQLGVTVDGRCGPNTFRALVSRWLQGELQQLGQNADRLATAGRVALLEAKRTWLETIVDPPDESNTPLYKAGRARIDGFINSADGLGWSWPPYKQDNDYQWCGAFVASAWRAGGLKLDLRRSFFSSTHRLDAYGQYRDWRDGAREEPPADRPRRFVKLDERSAPRDAMFDDSEPPRAGDILLVGGRKNPRGSHICLVESYDMQTGTFTTIEGNATGPGPNGRTIEGVIRATRLVGLRVDQSPGTYHARRLIRPSIHDLT